MRTTLVCGLLDAARHNLDRDVDGAAAVRMRAGFLSNGQERLPDEQLHLGLRAGRRVRAGDVALAGAAGRLLCCQGAAGRAAGRARRRLAARRRRAGVPAPGRAAEVLIAGREAGWVGRGASARRPLVRPRASRPTALELDLDVTLAAARRVSDVRGPDHLPGGHPGHRGRRGRGGRGADGGRRRARGGRAGAADRRGVRPLSRRAGWRGQEVARAAARVPGRRSHADRRRGGGAARADPRGARSRGGGSLRE